MLKCVKLLTREPSNESNGSAKWSVTGSSDLSPLIFAVRVLKRLATRTPEIHVGVDGVGVPDSFVDVLLQKLHV